jgi:hypothetical protein
MPLLGRDHLLRLAEQYHSSVSMPSIFNSLMNSNWEDPVRPEIITIKNPRDLYVYCDSCKNHRILRQETVNDQMSFGMHYRAMVECQFADVAKQTIGLVIPTIARMDRLPAAASMDRMEEARATMDAAVRTKEAAHEFFMKLLKEKLGEQPKRRTGCRPTGLRCSHSLSCFKHRMVWPSQRQRIPFTPWNIATRGSTIRFARYTRPEQESPSPTYTRSPNEAPRSMRESPRRVEESFVARQQEIGRQRAEQLARAQQNDHTNDALRYGLQGAMNNVHPDIATLARAQAMLNRNRFHHPDGSSAGGLGNTGNGMA